ncbi:MAG: oligosaccharide flippase family protein [Patescibacteria group bacterium]
MMLRFKKSPVSIQVSKNVLYQVIGKIVGVGTTFFITLSLARLFGALGYGDIVKVVTYVSAFFIIADFGFNAVYLSDEQQPHTLPSLFFLRTAWSFVLLGIAYIFLRVVPIGVDDGYTIAVRLGIVLYAPSIVFQSIITTTNAVFQKHLHYDYSMYAVVGGSLVGLIALYFFSTVPHAPSLVGAYIYLTGSMATSFIALWQVRKLEKFTLQPNAFYIKKLFIRSFPIGLTLVANLIYSHADSVILTLTRSTTEVGTYGFAYRFFETLLVIPTFIMNASYPVLLSSQKQSVQLLFRRYKKLIVIMLISSTGVGLCAWLAGPLLVLVRPDFLPSVIYIRILVLSLPLFFLSSLVMWMLFVFNKRWELSIIYIVAMMGNIGANMYYVPTHGAIASAWITIISEALVLVATYSVLWAAWGVNKKLHIQ